MFKNIFPDHLNRLVYRAGAEKPAPAPKGDSGFIPLGDVRTIGQSEIGRRMAQAPESNFAKAHRVTEAIFQASNSRMRYEPMTAVEAAKLVNTVGKELQAMMKDRTEMTLPAPNGNTLLVKKMRNGGIVAVAYEARGNERADRPAQHLIVGEVPNASGVAFDMVVAFRHSDLFEKQEAVARATQPEYKKYEEEAKRRGIKPARRA